MAARRPSSGLAVGSREALLKGGDRGPAIVAGDPDKSLLIQAIRRTHDEVKMPPKKRLADEAVADLSRVDRRGSGLALDEGRQGPRSKPDNVRDHGTGRSSRSRPSRRRPTRPAGPIGRSIDSSPPGAGAAGLQPVRRADRRTLIRRVTFDLIGLPPTPEEVDAFLDDRAPGRFRQGRRSPARLAALRRALGTALDGRRPLRRHRRRQRRLSRSRRPVRYRDYIIDAFNRDKPYDQFVREQLAGDILARGKSGAGLRRVGRRHRLPRPLAALRHRPLRAVAPDARGRDRHHRPSLPRLTLRCARCHDHKFDPVTQRDYYALYGIFASTTFPYAGSEESQSKGFPRMNFVPLVEPARAEPSSKAYRERLAELERIIPPRSRRKIAGRRRWPS